MAVADSAGFPLAVCIADGSRHDVALVEQTLDSAFIETLPGKLIGDKGFDSRPLASALWEQRNIELIAPVRQGRRPNSRRQDGRPLRRYRRRWKVERLFSWLKQFRRIATRWERSAVNYLGMVYLGCMCIILRKLATKIV